MGVLIDDSDSSLMAFYASPRPFGWMRTTRAPPFHFFFSRLSPEGGSFSIFSIALFEQSTIPVCSLPNNELPGFGLTLSRFPFSFFFIPNMLSRRLPSV